MKSSSRFPSLEDIEHYERNGYVTSPRIIPDELIEEALYGVHRYYAGERDWQLPISGGFLDWRAEQGAGLRINDYVSLQNPELRKLVTSCELGQAFASLMRAETVRLFHDQLIGKPPDSSDKTAIGWHVDAAYWRTCTSIRMMTAWIPLVEYAIDMGPLMVIPGSHRWQGNERMATFNTRDLGSLEAQMESASGSIERVPILIRPGQVSFHHARMVHGSMPNRGKNERIALTVHVQDGDNRYQRFVDCRDMVAVHVNDALCRRDRDGQPDYTDPDICPVLWNCAREAAPTAE
ncbi:MAG: phytanoyl-CoA dioxygenase family protein [Edaphobacter sp.]|uniref:phytanoyl-CoA dioxygenase family protein n=1 Tax=Edaphobacter sp. TaxID=1934404 RepID=UPI002981163B|nr:phytanoyl-CoA dioxygenase family protein [Edaphobacter sp.]MDW5265514.1 phytanoyl-CoA dioxygenase family protein [Edaphobacter sp.]